MSDVVLIALIGNVAPALIAVGTLIQVLRLGWAQKALRRDVNGRMSDLLARTAGQARAEGRAEGPGVPTPTSHEEAGEPTVARKPPPKQSEACADEALSHPATLRHFFEFSQALNEREGTIMSILDGLRESITKVGQQITTLVERVNYLQQQVEQNQATQEEVNELQQQLDDLENQLGQGGGDQGGGGQPQPDQGGGQQQPAPPQQQQPAGRGAGQPQAAFGTGAAKVQAGASQSAGGRRIGGT